MGLYRVNCSSVTTKSLGHGVIVEIRESGPAVPFEARNDSKRTSARIRRKDRISWFTIPEEPSVEPERNKPLHIVTRVTHACGDMSLQFGGDVVTLIRCDGKQIDTLNGAIWVVNLGKHSIATQKECVGHVHGQVVLRKIFLPSRVSGPVVTQAPSLRGRSLVHNVGNMDHPVFQLRSCGTFWKTLRCILPSRRELSRFKGHTRTEFVSRMLELSGQVGWAKTR